MYICIAHNLDEKPAESNAQKIEVGGVWASVTMNWLASDKARTHVLTNVRAET